jgi:hypothetical protein
MPLLSVPQDVEAARSALLAARQTLISALYTGNSLAVAQSQELTARQNLAAAIAAWFQKSSPTDLATPTEDLGRLSAAFPIVLFPVRLETRFFPGGNTTPTCLQVRVYPDEIFLDTHEPALTDAEVAAGKSYWQSVDASGSYAGRNVEKDQWRALVTQFGAPRAAWIVRALTPDHGAGFKSGVYIDPPTNTYLPPASDPDPAHPLKFPFYSQRPAAWSRPGEAVLPDRWVVMGFRSGKKVCEWPGNRIVEPLALTADPYSATSVQVGALTADRDVAWTLDYATAKDSGMAIDVPLSPTDVSLGFDRLVVYGVKTSMRQEDTALHLQSLFDSHHYTSGTAFVPQGTPTNNTSARPSGYPVDDRSADLSFVTERGDVNLLSFNVPDRQPPYRGDRIPAGVTTNANHGANDTTLAKADGPQFGAAMGLASDVYYNVDGFRGQEQVRRKAMADALWPTTLGYFMYQMMDPIFAASQQFDDPIGSARAYFGNNVSGRGPAPAFRIGETPYGLLPTLSIDNWQQPGTDTDSALEGTMIATLRAMRAMWITAAAWGKVPRIGATPDDPDGDLVKVLSMNASTVEVFIRTAVGPAAWANMSRLLRTSFSSWQQPADTLSSGEARAIRQPFWNPQVARMRFENHSERFGGPLVSSDPVSESDQLNPNYISALWGAPAQLKPALPANAPLLQVLLRQSILMEFQRLLYLSLLPGGGGTANQRPPVPKEKELWLTTDSAKAQTTVWDLFQQYQGVEQLSDATSWRDGTLNILAGTPTAELQRLLTEALDVTSHRLDAWLTALATRRLKVSRAATTSTDVLPPGAKGSYFGGYGWVENLKWSGVTSADNAGFIHGPSVAHAAAAAVLRSGHLTRSGANAEAYAVDLSSARVRGAREILSEVRQAQPLGALLGYTLERGLHDLGYDEYIAPFRSAFPQVADKRGTPSNVADKELIAARNVVDGLALLRAFNGNPSSVDSIVTGTDPTHASVHLQYIHQILASMNETMDGLADVLMAEGVFQVVRGNVASASATLDAVANGLARPPDPEIARAPRQGTGLTHRVALLVAPQQNGAAPPSTWPTEDARTRAEPTLNAWAAGVLWDPTKVKCTVNGQAHYLTELQMSALAVLALARDLANSDTGSILDRRVLAAAGASSGTIFYNPAVDADERTFVAAFEHARAIADVLSSGRYLEPDDVTVAANRATAAFSSDDVSHFKERAIGISPQTNPPTQIGVKWELDYLVSTFDGSTVWLNKATAFLPNGAVPPAGTTGAALTAFANGVLSQLQDKQTAVNAAVTAFGAVAAEDLAGQVAALSAVFKAGFGRDFVAIPGFMPSGATDLSSALGQGPAFINNDPSQPRKFLQRAARTHAGVSRWRTLSVYGDAMGRPAERIDVCQLPYDATARWAALLVDPSAPPVPGRVSFVLLGTGASPPSASSEWRGVLLDEWTEVIPSNVAQTGVAFHHESPRSVAPQTVLVALAASTTGNWSADDLTATLNETLDLAKIRAVDTDLLPQIRQLIPTCFVAYNPDDETVSTSFVDRRVQPPTIVIT